MPIALDRRTRFDADVRKMGMEDFLASEFPDLAARNGALVVQGIEAFDAPPLAVEVGDRSWSFSGTGGGLAVSPGIADGALVVSFDEDAFSDWVQNQRSFNAMIVARELRYRGGSERDVSVWDSLWLALLEGWPLVDDGIEFLDRHGASLDLGRVFTPDDDPADVAHFLREAGFLHLRGWVDPTDMRAVSDDMDRALPDYHEDDGRSWWATVADGTRLCVRLQEFVGRSPTTASILRGDRWDQLRRTLAGSDDLVQKQDDSRALEALIKPRHVVAGASDVSFHRDCHFGRHAYQCSSTVVGIAVTASSEANGQLRVIAGSHRVLMPVEIAKTRPYLPVVAIPTDPGDVTVHLSCTLHESTPPLVQERRVMYTGFSLARRETDAEGARALSELRERVSRILLEQGGRP
ncbi:phytanoyl-CoA dioxygenase family protein [Pseudofrankia sp. BMG5.37]|uniref:phytanoyl-CoA dioxygenase family protein n=1 Tax=Pseudofrankia sp. BMG5.37 TaxID=3050035 RepID=UPI002895B463|nr:phytanoyl-CoA dioxygenase family protein [Pseudofrankia sp. BMG5.37]MDT3439172.1 phytanoyl-CoA dioxygenase family protein [Pseudofrankia sp. BMG5.37]